MAMDISDLKREGDHPVISRMPATSQEFLLGAGRWGRFGEELKRTFPARRRSMKILGA
jgi:hypothetical protein